MRRQAGLYPAVACVGIPQEVTDVPTDPFEIIEPGNVAGFLDSFQSSGGKPPST